MTTHATSSNEPVGRLLGWLGLRHGKTGAQAGDAASPGGRTPRDMVTEARQQLVGAIASFLLDHDLDVSAANLLIAHSAFSGINPRLARQIATRSQTADGITQQWLDELAQQEPIQPDRAELDRLVTRLETNLDTFQTNTKAARNATSDYGVKLEKHVTDLQQVQVTGELVTHLADLAKAMLDRTRHAEEEMRRSEDEAKSLRRSLARAKRDAEVDYLTGLPNRRAFEVLLERHYEEARASCEPLSVAFCDIDNFKLVNDTHGHEAGDRVIKLIADTLAHISNDHCHVARHGGEEFVMLFRGLPPSEAAARLDEAREQLAGRRLINRKTDEPFGQITFSGGVADVFGYNNARDALKAADDALYRAKESGRNRIELAGI
ncbi:GGDEF domain-containing protein [Sphingopyxis terrae]|uniref:diguanylate cyclase n=3 Tax=Sphingomonadaceae TaxID=41297 RepID=A0A1Y6EIZ8_9SPHN|nr:diguanylate cyclase [Sphingopyxis terrae subsp. terrae NBRC 15098]MBN8805601.1 GGDEF domain-containing protein [Sphingopyxis terrae]MBU7588241.1 GGDEF domain-containing protein [Sphingopyxis terrae]SMQ60562.1 diguanylate cyclase [Sphingopyxis terrae subsp. ummariensis]